MSNSLWIILASFLVAANAGLLGNFLILRKQAMIGDAISHAVLPGLAIAFIVTNSTSPVVLFVGAALAGMGATLLIGFFEDKLGIGADVAIGITFTTFFALGIILISLYTQKVDLDQQCVLYGHPVLIPFDVWVYGGKVMGPKAIYSLLVLLLANSFFVAFYYRTLVITSFDPHFANVIGIRMHYVHYLLMFFTALTTVVAFKIVGAVLVVAFLVVPTATAYLLTDQLKWMIFYTLVIDIWVTCLGYYLAVCLEGSVAGAMGTVAGGAFLLTLGVTSRRRRRQSLHGES
ncbi:MAG: metal ABC transporter permease [Bacteroidota bacterium]